MKLLDWILRLLRLKKKKKISTAHLISDLIAPVLPVSDDEFREAMEIRKKEGRLYWTKRVNEEGNICYRLNRNNP